MVSKNVYFLLITTCCYLDHASNLFQSLNIFPFFSFNNDSHFYVQITSYNAYFNDSETIYSHYLNYSEINYTKINKSQNIDFEGKLSVEANAI